MRAKGSYSAGRLPTCLVFLGRATGKFVFFKLKLVDIQCVLLASSLSKLCILEDNLYAVVAGLVVGALVLCVLSMLVADNAVPSSPEGTLMRNAERCRPKKRQSLWRWHQKSLSLEMS